METGYLFDKVSELTEKFKHFFRHKKKLTALENYSEAAQFKHNEYLPLIKKCMNDGFLGEKEAEFLSYMTDKYFSASSYLDWTHKTKWLKGEINRIRMENRGPEPAIQMTIFDFLDKKPTLGANVPVELLNMQKQQMARRV